MSSADTRMVTALVQLRQALVRATLPVDVPDVDAVRAVRSEMVAQLEDYVIPRLTTLEAPMLAVVGGSTGAGKSTLVNSLVGHLVTAPGVLRPTTRSPVLVHHPDDVEWFGRDRLLPGLVRVSHATDDPDSLQLVPSEHVPRWLAVLDAPDVDSVEERNRTLAAQLLAAGDLWLFVTSAARYADQVPWSFLQQAAERSTAVAVVLDRTPDEAIQTVSTHLARMLASRGLKDSPLFTVTEGKVDDEGVLPARHVADIRGWLESLAEDAGARAAVVRQTLDGAVRAISRQAYSVADAAVEQPRVADSLREEAATAYDDARRRTIEACVDGTALRGEVLARWQELVGTGDLVRSLESRRGGLRDRLVGTVRGKPHQAEQVTVAMEAALVALVVEHAESAAERVRAAWSQQPAGAGLLAEASDDIGRASRDLGRRAERTVRDWQLDVLETIRAEGADRRTNARYLAFGVNGLAVALMVVVLAPAGVAGGSAASGQQLLEAVFDDEAVGRLATRARQSLEERFAGLLVEEQSRYRALVDGLALQPDSAERLRRAARRVDDLRYEASQAGSVPGGHR